MKSLSFLFSICLGLGYLPLAAQQKTIVDNNVQVRTVGTFNSIKVSSAFDVFLSQAPEHTVAVSASDVATRDRITTEVRNGTLYIGIRKESFNIKGSQKLRAYISAPDLKGIDLSGSSDLTIDKVFKTEALEINISGSSDFKGNLDATSVRMNSSGSSDFILGGKIENLKLVISGSSDVKAYDLEVDYCDITCSGTSDVQITMNKEMKVSVSGKSRISYKGNGIIKEQNVSGSSRIVKAD